MVQGSATRRFFLALRGLEPAGESRPGAGNDPEPRQTSRARGEAGCVSPFLRHLGGVDRGRRRQAEKLELMTDDKHLIEDYLPIRSIAREGTTSKGHINTLHLWWARRPLVACRAATYAALEPISEFMPNGGSDTTRRHSDVRTLQSS